MHALCEALFLAMAMHPEAQKKAQEELDAVVGPVRLPEFSDRDALPYTSAILKEVMRWHVIVPMGVLHQTMSDDEPAGFFIPAGTVINTNIWSVHLPLAIKKRSLTQYSPVPNRAMSRDSEDYPGPETFRPERF